MSLNKAESARRNGAKSRGPVTEEGKQRSSLNATKHGCTADKVAVLESEDSELFDSIFTALCEQFQPQTNLERDLLLQAACARWRLRRVWRLETSLFDLKIMEQRKHLNREYTNLRDSDREAFAFTALADHSRGLALTVRYEARVSREYQRAISDFLIARAQKPLAPETIEKLDEERPDIELPDIELPNEELPNEPTAPRDHPNADLPSEPNPASPLRPMLVLPNEPKQEQPPRNPRRNPCRNPVR